MPRFLHTADWQIGRSFSRFAPEDALALAEARFTVVERLAGLARESGVDAVLVAGDVFDAQTVSDRTIRRLFNAMSGYTGPWILIPGNHDAALAESVWSRALRLGAVPQNVHLALRPEVIEFVSLGFAVLPAPLTQRHTPDDLTEWFDQADTPPELLRIGLAHGSVQGILAQDIDSPNPIAADRAHRARLDYLALGDWHGTRCIDERTWYSGTPEQDRFKANEPGKALLVDIAGRGIRPEVSVQAVGQHEWMQWTEHFSVNTDVENFLGRLRQVPERAVLELRLSGEIDLQEQQRLDRALSEAGARCRSLLVDDAGLHLQPTEADLRELQADGYVGDVIAELRQAQAGPEASVAREALAILSGLLRERRAQENQP